MDKNKDYRQEIDKFIWDLDIPNRFPYLKIPFDLMDKNLKVYEYDYYIPYQIGKAFDIRNSVALLEYERGTNNFLGINIFHKMFVETLKFNNMSLPRFVMTYTKSYSVRHTEYYEYLYEYIMNGGGSFEDIMKKYDILKHFIDNYLNCYVFRDNLSNELVSQDELTLDKVLKSGKFIYIRGVEKDIKPSDIHDLPIEITEYYCPFDKTLMSINESHLNSYFNNLDKTFDKDYRIPSNMVSMLFHQIEKYSNGLMKKNKAREKMYNSYYLNNLASMF